MVLDQDGEGGGKGAGGGRMNRQLFVSGVLKDRVSHREEARR
jgi:hypothetical protein